MRLPLKFLPQRGQLILEMIGGLVMIGFGADFFSDYASPAELSRIEIPFLIGSIILLLFGLAWFTIAALNYFGGSPFNYLIVDRVGITYRNFWRENRYAWKDLGPIQAERLTAWQGRSSQRRHWITADTIGTEAGGGGAFWSNPEGTLRIPAAVYLSGGGFLVGSLDVAPSDAAGWLEQLRQLARTDDLEGENVPAPPACFRTPIAIDTAAKDAHAPPPVERR